MVQEFGQNYKKIENEIPSKEFFQDEITFAKNKAILEIRSEEQEVLNNPNQVVIAIERFYCDLWGKQTQTNEKEICKSFLPKLENQLQKLQELERLITFEEVNVAIDGLNKNSSPGLDGLTTKFYQEVKNMLLKKVFGGTKF